MRRAFKKVRQVSFAPFVSGLRPGRIDLQSSAPHDYGTGRHRCDFGTEDQFLVGDQPAFLGSSQFGRRRRYRDLLAKTMCVRMCLRATRPKKVGSAVLMNLLGSW